MKLRYQMRGLGIGIVVTAILMGVATKDGRPLTDAEIRAKAYELGMVDGDSVTLKDLKGNTPEPKGTSAPKGTLPPETTPAPGTTQAPDATAAPGTTKSPDTTAGPGTTKSPDATAGPGTTQSPDATAGPGTTKSPDATAGPATPEPTVVPPAPENTGPEEAVTIVIRSGANSYTVSIQLAEAGLIESVSDYDEYLCSNGYATRICVGTYQIPSGATEEQIAKIITKTR